MPNLVSLALDSAVDADQEYIHFMGSATPPSACYACFLKYRV